MERTASEEKEGQYFRQERIYGRFERAFHLPDGVQDDAIEAGRGERSLAPTIRL